jgi:hypothetical protein
VVIVMVYLDLINGGVGGGGEELPPECSQTRLVDTDWWQWREGGQRRWGGGRSRGQARGGLWRC